MINTLLFDLDDTLFIEKEFVKSGFKQVAIYLSNKYPNLNGDTLIGFMVDSIALHGRDKTFDRLLAKYDLSEEVTKLVNVYRSHQPKIKLGLGVDVLLKQLKQQGYKLGIITDGDPQVQKNKVSALGLFSIMDCVIYSDELGVENRKPSQLPYINALQLLRSSTRNSVYVGDNPNKDFVGAKELGLITIRVKQGEYQKLVMDEIFEADYAINSVLEIDKLLKRLK
jgi:putative hydrolase of the HAD superfamily